MLIKDGFFVCIKKQPENLDLAVGITYFVYVLEPVVNNEDATYHEPKLIDDGLYAVAMTYYHLQ